MSLRSARLIAMICLPPLAAIASNALPAQAVAASPMPAGSAIAVRLDDYLSRLAALGYTGALIVDQGGQTLYEKGFGLADRARGIPITTGTVFSVGSITKQFTAAAILRLEQDGKLRVTDSIGRWLPSVPPDKAGITLHHLLTHTAGLRSDFAPTDYDSVGRDEYVRRAMAAPLESPPGARFSYANAGYSLLAAIVERASGEGYEAYLHDHLFVPAGMRQTGYLLPRWPRETVAHGYLEGRDWGTILDKPWAPDGPWWQLRGNGGIHSTLGDMVRWSRALDTDVVLNAAERRKLFTPYVAEGPGARSSYGYGWSIERTPDHGTLIQHNGGNRVFVAEYQRFVDRGITIFLTSTVSEWPASPWVPAIDRIVFGEPVDLPPKSVALARAALARYPGSYRLPSSGEEFTVDLDAGGLTLAPVGQHAMSALLTGDTAAAQRLAQLSTRTEAMLAAAGRGDYSLLGAAFGGRTADQVAARDQDLMQDRVSRLGAFRGYRVMGTAALGGGGAITVVRADFERRSVYNRYFWLPDGTIDEMEPSPVSPSVILVPQSASAFTTFGPRAPLSVPVTFELGPDGAPVALTLKVAGGLLRAPRAR
jgi:CubicO group peptidase (beta-lactamase class C family)